MNDDKTERLDPNVDLDIPDDIAGAMEGRHTLEMDGDEIRTALREVGLTRMDVRRWKGCAAVGKVFEKMGAVQVCVGEWVYANRQRDFLIQKCREFLKDASTVDDVAALTECMNTVLNDSDKNTDRRFEAIKSEMVKVRENDHGGMLPPKGTPLVAVQVNQTGGETTVKSVNSRP